MIKRVTASEVIAGCRRTLGLSNQGEGLIDDVLLAAVLRRSAGINCPCSRATLRASVLDCLHALDADEDSLSQRIDDAIEALTVCGDLLELDEVVTEDSDVRQTWVFAAPPGFVARSNGTVFIFGVVPDQDAFLPSSLGDRVVYDGYARFIEPQSDEDLAEELQVQGLHRLSHAAWFKVPSLKSPEDMLNRVDRYLARQSSTTMDEDLKILDPVQPVTYYRGRWVTPANQTGIFVARRPQEFGAPLWCVVQLENGAMMRLLDLPFEKTRWRACDAAWHLQMAIDHCRHHPQQYRRRAESDCARFDFFSPLPQWAQRRLMIFGKSVPPEKSLFSYLVPETQAEEEEDFLQQKLWLSRTEESE